MWHGGTPLDEDRAYAREQGAPPYPLTYGDFLGPSGYPYLTIHSPLYNFAMPPITSNSSPRSVLNNTLQRETLYSPQTEYIDPEVSTADLNIHHNTRTTIDHSRFPVRNQSKTHASLPTAAGSHSGDQNLPALCQLDYNVRVTPKPIESYKAAKLNSTDVPKEIVFFDDDWSVIEMARKRKEPKEPRKVCKDACLRCQVLRRKCSSDNGQKCPGCTKTRRNRLLWLSCVRPKFRSINIPETFPLMHEKKNYLSFFVQKHLLPTVPRSSIVNIESATTYLKQWLAGGEISADFTLGSLLHTEFERMVPAFGANLKLLIGFIVADNVGIDLRIDALGRSSEELSQLREHISNHVLFEVERELQNAHTKIVHDSGRTFEGSGEVTVSLLVLLLICGVSIGCAIECALPGIAKDKMRQHGDRLCEHLCRYLILAGQQLKLIASSMDEAALFERWRRAQIVKTAIENSSATQSLPQKTHKPIGASGDIQDSHVATTSRMTPGCTRFDNTAACSTTPEEATPAFTESFGVTPQAYSPHDTSPNLSGTVCLAIRPSFYQSEENDLAHAKKYLPSTQVWNPYSGEPFPEDCL